MKKTFVALSVLVLATTVLAIAPDCSEIWQTFISATNDYIPDGSISSTFIWRDTAVGLNGLAYYDVTSKIIGGGQFQALPKPLACYARNYAYATPAISSLDSNRFYNQAYYRKVYDNNTDCPLGCCKDSGIMLQDFKQTHSSPCCGPGTGVGCGSPLVADPNGVGFEGNITTLAGGVKFDFDNTGKKEQIAWIRKGSGLLFLVYDWDHDGGKPRDGHDLIGTTSCPNVDNGFKALGKLDSDGDGEFTRKDKEWHNVGLWDGYSNKIVSLDSRGYTAIGLKYRKSVKTVNGSGLSLWAYAWGDVKGHDVVDLYFVKGQ